MRTRSLMSFTLLLIIINHPVFAQENSEKRLAILPFTAVGVEESVLQSAEAILRSEINTASDYSIIPDIEVQQAIGDQPCNDLDCSVDIGNKLNASRILLCNLTGLGEKILVYYTMVDVKNGAALIKDKATALYVEDLDAVLKRVAVSVSNTKPIQKTAEVDNITAEESLEPLRRSTNTLSGFTFGYLFPQEGYDNDDRSFTLDFRVAQELERFEVGILFAARKGFAINIFSNFLSTKKDICPYLGGAFGFHWIVHEERIFDAQSQTYRDVNNRGDGFELTLNGGIKLFRTYDFQILANFGYLITFNDFDDRATVFTIGLVK